MMSLSVYHHEIWTYKQTTSCGADDFWDGLSLPFNMVELKKYGKLMASKKRKSYW
jgi:hypothetical protein